MIFAPRAARDLELAVGYVARHAGAEIAERFGLRLLEKALSLASFPERGRIVPELGPPFREIIHRSYRIVYRVSETRVEVVRFWHAARGAPQIDSDEFRESGTEER
ncbi:MAG: type II toxin-antitoxin system RelE/ParE family toxin [Verrucomicrobiae bacterium]|nr:type II toxin-antitoxin system RelE/ParE family toxin [Verrucomicrobiae bacterium]